MASRKLTGFSEEVGRWMEARSTAIAAVTQKKGMPMTYGTGKEPEKKKEKK
jgi:hypothetical protein